MNFFQQLFRKSQMDLFAGSQSKQPKKMSGLNISKPKTEKEARIGDMKQEGQTAYIFLETTIGKPRWHRKEELIQMKKEGKAIPEVAQKKMPFLKPTDGNKIDSHPTVENTKRENKENVVVYESGKNNWTGEREYKIYDAKSFKELDLIHTKEIDKEKVKELYLNKLKSKEPKPDSLSEAVTKKVQSEKEKSVDDILKEDIAIAKEKEKARIHTQVRTKAQKMLDNKEITQAKYDEIVSKYPEGAEEQKQKKLDTEKKEAKSKEIPQFKGTEEAQAFGKTATPEQITELKLKREEALTETRRLKDEGKNQEAFNKVTEAQLYREAVEASEKKEPIQSEPEHKVGDTKTEDGHTYRLNENHRWEKVDEEPDPKKESKREYVDVGEKIGGARKDLWAEKLQNGEILTTGDVNLADLEKDPAQAYKVVTKDNYVQKIKEMGEQFKVQGFESGAIYLMMKLNDFITQHPEDTPIARQNFVSATDLLQRTVYKAKTAKQLIESIRDLSQMHRGYYIPEEHKKVIDALRKEWNSDREVINKLEKKADTHYARQQELNTNIWRLEHRKKEVPQLLRDELKSESEKWGELLSEIRPIRDKNSETYKKFADIEKTWDEAANKDPHSQRNIINSLGEKFINAIDRRSQAFVDAMNKSLNMKPDDYNWLLEGAKQKKKSQKSIDILKEKKWERTAPETPEREGKKTPSTFKPEDLMKSYGIRGVEYGNWMDEESAKHHTELAGMAFYDLADILGLPIERISYNGRLAMAFGARGKGNFKLTAAAHYEPSKAVINMTKFSGGGSLAHEWGHFFDNIISKLSYGEKKGETTYLSSGSMGEEVAPEIKTAMQNIITAMTEGDFQNFQSITPKEKNRYTRWGQPDRYLQDGMTGQQAYDKLYEEYDKQYQSNKAYYVKSYPDDLKRQKKLKDKFLRETKEVAQYLATKTNSEIRIPDPKNPKTSKFYANSLNQGTYFSSRIEMFARSFEAYISDRLDELKQKNSYLVYGISEKNINSYLWYKQVNGVMELARRDEPGALPLMPYPEGEERKRINEAMNKFIDAAKGNEIIKKSLFGEI